MKNPFNKQSSKRLSAIHQHLDEDNRLNRYRFAKHVPEFQLLLKDTHIKKELGTIAVAKLLELTELLVPALTKDGVLSVSNNQTDQSSIPLWFADDAIKVDYFPEFTKDPKIREILDTNISSELLERVHRACIKEFAFGYDKPGGYTLENERQPIILVFSGLFGANMASTMCHELVHARQIIDGNFATEDRDDDTNASGELEAYHYQAVFEKGLRQRDTIDYSIYGISGLAQKINFIRIKHARSTEPYRVTPKMKQELIGRGFGSAVFSSLREEALEKTD